ncbi:MAG: hypothetical protein A3G41_01710 [Elusimicrobia bacterium RIFCSPLOWO2_12_FULL_59_9]|nr:MAG: hypothetical protein A3G41_01710 [Elusimicrobia bacterium RIFCSPLOWO2_12_FULL_59_9]
MASHRVGQKLFLLEQTAKRRRYEMPLTIYRKLMRVSHGMSIENSGFNKLCQGQRGRSGAQAGSPGYFSPTQIILRKEDSKHGDF